MLVLFTDTDSDFTPESAKQYGYNLISMPYIMDDKTVYPYEDADFEKNYDSHEFYEKLRKGALPTTAGLSPEKYKSYFEPFFEIVTAHRKVNFLRQDLISLSGAVADHRRDHDSAELFLLPPSGRKKSGGYGKSGRAGNFELYPDP